MYSSQNHGTILNFVSWNALLNDLYNAHLYGNTDIDQGWICDKGVMSSQGDKESDKTPKSFMLGKKVDNQDCCQCLPGLW